MWVDGYALLSFADRQSNLKGSNLKLPVPWGDWLIVWGNCLEYNRTYVHTLFESPVFMPSVCNDNQLGGIL